MNVISARDWNRFLALRRLIFDGIKHALELDSHHKGYEGALDVTFSLPAYFEADRPMGVILTLHCYVLGPSRHYDWRGETLAECLDLAEQDVLLWIKELEN